MSKMRRSEEKNTSKTSAGRKIRSGWNRLQHTQKELFPDSSAISEKTKKTIRPLIKDHYGPETEH